MWQDLEADTPPLDDDPTRTWRRPVACLSQPRLAVARQLLEDGYTDEALAMYLELLSQDERELQALKGAGIAWIRLGNYRRASQALRSALAVTPTDPELHYHLAISSLGLGSRPEAENALRALSKSAPALARDLDHLLRG
jgi:Flp pilus assembly protein TadD